MNDPAIKARRHLVEDNRRPAAVDVDHERIRAAVREILLAVGEDPDREGLRETPDRVARMYAELFSGLHKDPRQLLEKTFTEKYNEMVTVNDIAIGKIVGLSKLARVVEVLSRRPQVQERMTEQIADLLMAELDAQGVGVILEATHTCMTIRGVRKPGSIMTTSAMRGVFLTNQSTRTEF